LKQNDGAEKKVKIESRHRKRKIEVQAEVVVVVGHEGGGSTFILAG
jgi:hypothetical protein